MTTQEGATLHLFGAAEALPNGLLYRPEFIGAAEEESLLRGIAALELSEARYKAYTAKRRVASFGSSYSFTQEHGPPSGGRAADRFTEPALNAERPVPEFLLPLRDKVAAWLHIRANDLAHALVTEYRPGTALGWHRDAPQFAVVVGISLANACRMRFRPYVREPASNEEQRRRRAQTCELELAPRSAYVLREDVRWRWQHSIPTTKTLRYSITFRTMRTSP